MAHMSHTAALILQAVASGYRYGFDVMNATGLPSGTVYPALRRMEDAGYLHSRWERPKSAQREQRPARKYFEIRRSGADALAIAVERYRHLSHALPLAADARNSEA